MMPADKARQLSARAGPIRWGIIGAGDVLARKVGNSFNIPGQSELAGVMRRSQDKLAVVAAGLGVAFQTSSASELIENPDIDAVYIATPPAFHRDYALQASKAGKPCLIEKPVGRSLRECLDIQRAFRDVNIPWFAAYYRRHLPRFVRVRELLDARVIGPVVAVHYKYNRKPVDLGGWRDSPEYSGGGRFYDLAGHVFDLLNYWFGDIRFNDSQVANVIPGHRLEDTVTVSFRTRDDALGQILWNFDAPKNEEIMEIEGAWGRIRLKCMPCSTPVRVEVLRQHSKLKVRPRPGERIRKLLGKKADPWIRAEYTFESLSFVQAPMIQNIVRLLRAGDRSTDYGMLAVKTAQLLDATLDDYYGGRQDDFWNRPDTWKSLRARAVEHAGTPETAADFHLSEQQLAVYAQQGYLGPFTCHSRQWGTAFSSLPPGLNVHLTDPALLELCSHPSIAEPVDQLLGYTGISLMKTRIWRKSAEHAGTRVPWHQDAGERNGGYFPDGSPVPSVTVWLSQDGAGKNSGPVMVVPGSHKQLYGDWGKRLTVDIEGSGALDEVDLGAAIPLLCAPGEFWIFNSWLLHGSPANQSSEPRTGLNMRFVRYGDEVDDSFDYVTVRRTRRPGPTPAPS